MFDDSLVNTHSYSDFAILLLLFFIQSMVSIQQMNTKRSTRTTTIIKLASLHRAMMTKPV